MKCRVNRSASLAHTRSGVYMGGIGSGGFEIRADGRFYNCQIFNEWRARGMLNAFFVHGNDVDARVLCLSDLAPTGERIEGVSRIDYTGEFPCVTLSFPERDVTVTFTSIFIPGDVKNSSLPAVLMRVKGTGRLLFLLNAKYKATPRIEGRSVILHSDEGGIGLRSMRGLARSYRIADRYNVLRMPMNGHISNPPAQPDPDKPDDLFAAMEWKGTFDDEVIIGWYYPDSRDLEGNFLGHNYTNHFASCAEVIDYVKRNRVTLTARTRRFHRSIHESGRPGFLADAMAAQVSAFVKQSWFAKNNDFGVWEGSCCCCGLQTADVAYYGSWLYVSWFPELEKSGMRLLARFQRDDGWIPHFFPGTFTRIDEYRRKDMNMQFVLMVYRDYALWQDTDFLREMYPVVTRAIACVYGWDSDGDLMPEVEANAQTFDAWGFTGCAIYTASLWLGALRAAAKAAQVLGDDASARKWSADADVVAKNIVDTFWNGEYFILAVDGTQRDEGCLIDALSGDWYCRSTGLGGILDDAQVLSHLNACVKYNRKPHDFRNMDVYSTPGEEGWCYINGGYPDNRRVCHQQAEPWTGLEYSFALHLAVMGKIKRALQVVKEVQERKEACGMTYNHFECGGDYYRPMVIGAVWDAV